MFAVLLLGAAMTVSAEDASAKVVEAMQLIKRGEYERALAAAEEAVKQDPKSADVWYARGEANGHLRKHDEAIKDFNKALELDPKFDVAINQRGGERFKKGDI